MSLAETATLRKACLMNNKGKVVKKEAFINAAHNHKTLAMGLNQKKKACRQRRNCKGIILDNFLDPYRPDRVTAATEP